VGRFALTHHKAIPWRFIEFENGCQVIASHSLNQDGYARVWVGKDKKQIMAHRIFWELKNGSVPDGHEIDHICKCRACVNTDHLRLLHRSDHKADNNSTRYKHIKEQAEELWRQGWSKKELMAKFDRCRQTLDKWSKDWREIH